jgi:hypothetical protein
MARPPVPPPIKSTSDQENFAPVPLCFFVVAQQQQPWVPGGVGRAFALQVKIETKSFVLFNHKKMETFLRKLAAFLGS